MAITQRIYSLSEQLIGLEGWRVEAVTLYGETRRFIVGRNSSKAPMQIHLEIKTRRSLWGDPAHSRYLTVKPLYVALPDYARRYREGEA